VVLVKLVAPLVNKSAILLAIFFIDATAAKVIRSRNSAYST